MGWRWEVAEGGKCYSILPFPSWMPPPLTYIHLQYFRKQISKTDLGTTRENILVPDGLACVLKVTYKYLYHSQLRRLLRNATHGWTGLLLYL